MNQVAEWICEALKPPSNLPLDEWAEANIFLDNTSAIPGRIRLEFYPATRSFLKAAQNRRTRRVVVITSAQSAKTQGALIVLLNRIAENPVPAMWITATLDSAKDFAKKRMFPSILDCEPVRRLAPLDRSEWTGSLVQFATMNLMIRGANSRIGLQSDPVGLLVCDERREWKTGAIDLARKRVRTFATFLELSIGTAGNVGDSLHRDFLVGSQTFFHFNCPSCQHSQPFRFGKNKTPFFEKRERGGIVWPEDETTRSSAGVWNFDGVRKAARYQCEKCGELFANTDKPRLLKTIHEVTRNPKALPEKWSFHWNAIYMPLASCDFGEIAVEFLLANEALKLGDQEPMKAFVTETIGEPWQVVAQKVDEQDVLARQGDYFTGQLWQGEASNDSTLVLSLDRQQNHLVYVLRQWRKGGASRMIRCGILTSIEDVRAMQLDFKIRNVVGDDGGMNVTLWRTACARYGWHSFKGEDAPHFVSRNEDRLQVRSFWKESRCDPGIGTTWAGRGEIPLWLWSRPHFLEKLYHVFIRGHGAEWSIPKDASGDYLRQIAANEMREKHSADGSVSNYWHSTGADHFADCELMQLAFADVSGILQFAPQKPVDKQN